jgi:hypothetical protein
VAHERDRGPLAGAVERDAEADADLPCSRRDRDHAAKTPRAHAVDNRAGAVEDTVQVQIHVAPPVGRVELAKGGHGHALGDAGVVDQDVDLAESGRGFPHSGGHGGGIGHVEGQRHRAPPRVAQRTRRRLGALRVEVVDRYPRALRGQTAGDAGADALPRARHQRHA